MPKSWKDFFTIVLLMFSGGTNSPELARRLHPYRDLLERAPLRDDEFGEAYLTSSADDYRLAVRVRHIVAGALGVPANVIRMEDSFRKDYNFQVDAFPRFMIYRQIEKQFGWSGWKLKIQSFSTVADLVAGVIEGVRQEAIPGSRDNRLAAK